MAPLCLPVLVADFFGKQAGHTTGNLPETPRPLQLLCPHTAFRTLQESQGVTGGKAQEDTPWLRTLQANFSHSPFH